MGLLQQTKDLINLRYKKKKMTDRCMVYTVAESHKTESQDTVHRKVMSINFDITDITDLLLLTVLYIYFGAEAKSKNSYVRCITKINKDV